MNNIKLRLIFSLLAILFALLLLAMAGCGDDNDDTPADTGPGDDDDEAEPVPTTLDVMFVPVRSGDGWELGEGPGEPYLERNDLLVGAAKSASARPGS